MTDTDIWRTVAYEWKERAETAEARVAELEEARRTVGPAVIRLMFKHHCSPRKAYRLWRLSQFLESEKS